MLANLESPIFFLEVLNPTGTVRHPSILEEAGWSLLLGLTVMQLHHSWLQLTEGLAPNLIKVFGELQGHLTRNYPEFFSYRINKAVESYYMELSTFIWSKSFPLALRDDFKIAHKHNQKPNKFLRKLFLSVCLLQNGRLIKSEDFNCKFPSLQIPSIRYSNNCLIVWNLFKNT